MCSRLQICPHDFHERGDNEDDVEEPKNYELIQPWADTPSSSATTFEFKVQRSCNDNWYKPFGEIKPGMEDLVFCPVGEEGEEEKKRSKENQLEYIAIDNLVINNSKNKTWNIGARAHSITTHPKQKGDS